MRRLDDAINNRSAARWREQITRSTPTLKTLTEALGNGGRLIPETCSLKPIA